MLVHGFKGGVVEGHVVVELQDVYYVPMDVAETIVQIVKVVIGQQLAVV